jgi:regulator of sigma E protease
MLNLIYFIIILGIIVLVHEFGHFIFAKMFGIYVYEFAIGMGPKLFHLKSKKGETEYSIRAIPIGGFCSLAGEDLDSDDKEKIPNDRRLQSKPVWQRFLVMFFGAGNNFILAFLLLLVIAFGWGAISSKPVISELVSGNPAEEAGLEVGDYILKINGHKIKTSDDISIYLQVEDKSEPITFTVKRDGEELDIDVTPVKEEVDGSSIYRVGIVSQGEVERGFIPSIKYAFTKMAALFRQMVITLKGLFTGGLSVNQLSGPVGIYSIVGTQAQAGFENILYLIALLSINVGFINLIPFPAFDGGRILFLIIEKIKGSPVKPETENKIHTIGFILLLALMIYITFNDVLRLF